MRGAGVEKMIERHGDLYHVRERDEQAKAGNVNAARECMGSELIALFDPDLVPTANDPAHRASFPWNRMRSGG